MKNIIKITGGLCLVVTLLLIGVLYNRTEEVSANVALGGEYNATTTSALYNNPAKISLVRNGRGSFGAFSVREAGSAGGDFEFYDATTTDITKRASSLATSSIFLGSIPNDATVGDYDFDVNLNYGLVMIWTGGGTVATTTITTR